MSDARLCPSASAPFGPRARLHAFLTPAGTVAHVVPSLPVSALPPLPDDRAPETTLRFADDCVEGSCVNWLDGKRRCGLIDSIVEENALSPVALVPRCAIRRSCVWFEQRGAIACQACAFVVAKTAEYPLNPTSSKGIVNA